MMNRSRRHEIEKLADSVREKCNVQDYGFQNIFDSSEKLGFVVIRYPVGSDNFLGFAMIKDGDRIVFSNSSQILSREIFSIAHEIGHHNLHMSSTDTTLIKDDNFLNSNDQETEANYFAGCLLIPQDKLEKFIRLELDDIKPNLFNGLHIARIQNTFNSSFETVLIRLKDLKLIDAMKYEELKAEKATTTVTRFLNAINGNLDLTRVSESKKIPPEFLEWVISNYQEKLIPKSSLERALKYVDLTAEDIGNDVIEDEVNDDLDDLFRRME
jgi:Zn-dependent peptidase ImmA (M78 family)